jgi:hypothetical protein
VERGRTLGPGLHVPDKHLKEEVRRCEYGAALEQQPWTGQMECAAQPSDGRAVLEDELNDLAKQEDRLVDVIADGLIEREAAQRKSARIKSRRLEIYDEIARVGREKEGRQRALQYVQMARVEGIGTLVLGMPVEDKRKFFHAAFKTITLDGHGRGNWRKRWVKDYELSDALAIFILKHASA